jgi:hypothetical protein
MRTLARGCFNGHTEPRVGCAGCHHAFHVISPGSVTGGELIPPRVDGPLECPLCHAALHPTAVDGCSICSARFPSTLEVAMKASQETRTQIISLELLRLLVGWKVRIGGWIALFTGRAFGDLFARPDGSTEWATMLVALVAVPAVQWLLGRAIARRERLLPRLGPEGNITYGD